MAEGGAERSVIVAIDESDFSRHAFNYYLEYLHKSSDHFILQHVPELVGLRNATMQLYMEPHFVGDLVRQEQTRTVAFTEELQLMLRRSGKAGRVEVTEGTRPGQEICRLAESSGARLVVMAARGMGLDRRTPLGGVADYVLHHAHMPVVIYRSAGTDQFNR